MISNLYTNYKFKYWSIDYQLKYTIIDYQLKLEY